MSTTPIEPTPPLARPPAGLAPHPAAEAIPVMPEPEYQAFRTDIATRGLLVPLEITEAGVVLDGRQRLRAARELGHQTVPVRVVEVDDQLDYMLRAAVLRRQLTASQRAALVVELDQYLQLRTDGERRQRQNLRQTAVEVATLPASGQTRDQAASWAAVSPDGSGRCDGAPARPAAVRTG